jgi:hypothetical protein
MLASAHIPKELETLKDFSISVRQEPNGGRTSGYLDNKNKRLLDPPLIVEAKFDELNPPSQTRLFGLATSLVCVVSLLSMDFKGQDANAVEPIAENIQIMTSKGRHTYVLAKNLVGQTCKTASFLYDIDGKMDKKLFFVFADLGIRQAGHYQLVIQAIFMPRYDLNGLISSMTNLCRTNTSTFHIQPPATFSGNNGDYFR